MLSSAHSFRCGKACTSSLPRPSDSSDAATSPLKFSGRNRTTRSRNVTDTGVTARESGPISREKNFRTGGSSNIEFCKVEKSEYGAEPWIKGRMNWKSGLPRSRAISVREV